MVSPKYELLNQIASKVQVLDNPIKLKILAMLVEEGSKSVTDISKDMNLNFSTAHKYLEQLEAAGLVTSKQVSENRLKRIFSIGDFNIDISPHGLSNFLNQKKAEPKKTFKVINERGEEVQFDEKIFSQKYIKRGLPARTISNALDKVAEQAYDGITLLELRELFRQEMAKKLETITNVMEMIEESEIRGRTYYNLLKLNHPEALKMHMDGDIFIQNLGEPKLLNFVHDLYGIAQHGTTDKLPKNLSELFKQTLSAVNFVSSFTMRRQAIDSFNYFVAPFTESLSAGDLLKITKGFFSELDKLDQEISISIDVGRPKFVDTISTGYGSETYEKYVTKANEIANKLIETFSSEKYKNLRFVLKLWDEKVPKRLPASVFIANMTDKWQHPNASFVGFTRFDPEWKKWFGTKRVGEIQEIILNLPKIALTSVSLEDFATKTATQIDYCYKLLLDIAELTVGEFLRNQNTTLPSAQRERWNYLHLEDSAYSISMAGLPETIALLSKKYGNKNLEATAIKICNRFSDLQRKYYKKIRINLKQNRSESIAQRFSNFAKTQIAYDAPLPKKKLLTIQKFFPGGHVEFLTSDELEKIKGEFSFVSLRA